MLQHIHTYTHTKKTQSTHQPHMHSHIRDLTHTYPLPSSFTHPDPLLISVNLLSIFPPLLSFSLPLSLLAPFSPLIHPLIFPSTLFCPRSDSLSPSSAGWVLSVDVPHESVPDTDMLGSWAVIFLVANDLSFGSASNSHAHTHIIMCNVL